MFASVLRLHTLRALGIPQLLAPFVPDALVLNSSSTLVLALFILAYDPVEERANLFSRLRRNDGALLDTRNRH